MNKTLSFIIPAYNEEKNILKTLEKIKLYSPSKYNYEIIVVDHGSADKTASIAEKNGAKVYVRNEGTIAGLRNYGVSKASGEIFIFLDSDISLTSQWNKKIHDVIVELLNDAKILTGSWYSVPESPNWIEKYWFKPLEKNNNTHINSGHLIISRTNFKEISGFDEKLETGEDYDISMRAKNHGMSIVDNHDLKVIHEGYPDGLWDFMKREFWHGKGDATSISVILKSKVALLSLIFIVFHTVFLYSIFLSPGSDVLFVSIFGIALICLSASVVKFRRESISIIFINTIIYYFYFLARAATLFVGLFKRKIKKRQR